MNRQCHVVDRGLRGVSVRHRVDIDGVAGQTQRVFSLCGFQVCPVRHQTALIARFDKRPDLNALLLLIGIQELNQGIATFTKEQKQDLMHIATCRLFGLSGHYEQTHVDADGWPHYKLLRPVPFANLKEQERMLKWHVLEYFALDPGDEL